MGGAALAAKIYAGEAPSGMVGSRIRKGGNEYFVPPFSPSNRRVLNSLLFCTHQSEVQHLFAVVVSSQIRIIY